MNNIWINGLKVINKAVFLIISIFGIFGGIFLGFEGGGFVGFLMFIGVSVVSVLVAFLLVAAIMVFLELTENVIMINKSLSEKNNVYYNFNRVNGETTEYNTVHNAINEMREEELLKKGGWRCKECSKVNSSYIGTCSCGNSKYNN